MRVNVDDPLYGNQYKIHQRVYSYIFILKNT